MADAVIEARDIISQIGHEVRGPEDEVTFLLLNTEDNVLEISIDRGIPVQCACTLREVRLEPLFRFFRAYHANWKVREDMSLSEQIFSTRDKFAEGEDFLNPVPVIS